MLDEYVSLRRYLYPKKIIRDANLSHTVYKVRHKVINNVTVGRLFISLSMFLYLIKIIVSSDLLRDFSFKYSWVIKYLSCISEGQQLNCISEL